ncbi:hypothetical protein CSKR_113699 [Clonorchis sinensis]|uniref:Uncharacterized protein n=1 Tax=Clonorchis sinensis TaxID=79923 RepID=A0A3R7DE35_CLOSI|nr:hypothetical protein CSKR_113699 [Clonorchis sinensis]
MSKRCQTINESNLRQLLFIADGFQYCLLALRANVAASWTIEGPPVSIFGGIIVNIIGAPMSDGYFQVGFSTCLISWSPLLAHGIVNQPEMFVRSFFQTLLVTLHNSEFLATRKAMALALCTLILEFSNCDENPGAQAYPGVKTKSMQPLYVALVNGTRICNLEDWVYKLASKMKNGSVEFRSLLRAVFSGRREI